MNLDLVFDGSLLLAIFGLFVQVCIQGSRIAKLKTKMVVETAYGKRKRDELDKDMRDRLKWTIDLIVDTRAQVRAVLTRLRLELESPPAEPSPKYVAMKATKT